MRKTIFLTAVLCAVTAVAKIDPATRLYIEKKTAPAQKNTALAPSRADDGENPAEEDERPPYMPLMLQVADDSTVDSLVQKAVVIYNRRGDLLLTSVPVDSVKGVLSLEGVVNASSSGDLSAMLDEARRYTSADAVQGGFDLPQGYDGSSVVVGISDVGFDASHIAFSDGRLRQVHDYQTLYAMQRHATDPATAASMPTDDADETHATHVANILAGSWRGNPYHGVAPGADMVITTSDLYDSGILAGVEDIIAYAKSRGKRAVVNLSLGNGLGPHDGTDLFCRYLSAMTEDATILLSAGNNGNTYAYASQHLSEENPQGRVLVNDKRTWQGFKVQGYTDLWSSTSDGFDVRVEVYDGDTNEVVMHTPWLEPAQADTLVRVNADTYPVWADYFSGEVMVAAGLSTLNDRYNVAVSHDIESSSLSSRGNWSRYFVSLSWRRHQADVRVDVYADAYKTFIGNAESDPIGVSSRGSISNMCTAAGVISVGMCTTRESVPLNDKGDVPTGATIGTVSVHSSYSNVEGIARLPHFCAPGNVVISAFSSPYMERAPENDWSAMQAVDGSIYYWGAMGGTSMASPFAAGVMALWLQADPSLSNEQLLRTAIETARTDVVNFSDPRWGAGCIDAYAGLRKVISGVSAVMADIPPLVEVGADRRLRVTLPAGSSAQVRVYTLCGMAVRHDMPLPPGTYIVHVDGHKPVKIRV